MYWIQEIGGNGANRPDQKLIYAEHSDDLNYLPDIETEGNIAYAADGDINTIKKLKFGDQVLCLETSELYVLQSNNMWIRL